MSSTKTQPSEEKKIYDTEFVCYDDTLIGWGKLKGKPHSILKQEEWGDYARWCVDQGESFKCKSTQSYIINNVSLPPKKPRVKKVVETPAE